MYTETFGLSGLPFQLTPDPRFFFESSVHKKAMAHLLFGLAQREGFIVVTGDVGAGKTTVLLHLLSTLDPAAFVAAKIVSSGFSGDEMVRAVAVAFDLPVQGLDKPTVLRRIEDFLMANHERGLLTLLLIDEAQNVAPQALEELRMLSNFQVDGQVPLQSFLLAQPQFRRTLASPDLEQFRQRIIASYHMGPMEPEETRDYIRYRLTVVGWRGEPGFTDAAFAAIHKMAGGLPRKINTLCSRLMLVAFLDEAHQIDRTMVENVAEELRGELDLVLDRSPGSTGVLPQRAVATDDREPELAEVNRRVGLLERQVERHRQALHHFASLSVKILD